MCRGDPCGKAPYMGNFTRMDSRESLEALQKALEQTDEKKSYKDDRFWRPELDKSGNGYAEIRFLPPIEGEDLPLAKLYSHGFQGPGGWYIENSLTTLNKKDPVSEMNSQLWNSGLDSDKDLARTRRRKLNYISNVYIVADPANPQNEGKIFLFKYGKKIFDKIQEAMHPEFADEEAINPFSITNGASFKLKIRRVAGFVNYDKSQFDSSSDMSEVEFPDGYALTEFTGESNFKSYEDLKSRLEMVLGGNMRGTAESTPTAEESEAPAKTSNTNIKSQVDNAEEEDAMSYFEKLAND